MHPERRDCSMQRSLYFQGHDMQSRSGDDQADNTSDAASFAADAPVIMPTYADDILKGLSAEDLIDLLIDNEDHVPLNLIEECSRRGAEMEELLIPLFDSPIDEVESDGHWWLRLHAINILGLQSSAAAGTALIEALHCLASSETDDLYEWCSGYWHVWFRNKPDAIINKLRGTLADRHANLLVRIHLVECLAGLAVTRDIKALESLLDTFAGFAGNPREDHSLRMMSCLQLLDFPRERHRALLEKIVRQEQDDVDFQLSDIQDRYDSGEDDPESQQFDDPLSFYSPVEIERRQRDPDGESLDDALEGEPGTMFADEFPDIRDTPKTGRNDPCPCGSGKKFKKCCLT